MAKAKPRAKDSLTENQLKVIKDKYLRDAPTVEAWLRGVARNVALAEVLAHPKAEAWGVFDGVARTVERNMSLYHQTLPDYNARHANFRRLMDNLEQVSAKVPEAKALREQWAGAFYGLMARWDFLPNSPTLMNAGRELQQLCACYVLPVPDSMEGITKSLGAQSMIQKSGGGTGFSFSSIRPKGDLVKKTRGVASGALSFMKLFDTMTEVVKQGGTRRGANMAILRYDHPEIMDFIRMKTSPCVMENFNVSVGVDAAFMRAVEADAEYDLVNPRTGKVAGVARAKEVFDAMIECAWKTGDPGFVVLDRINASGSNTTPALGFIETTNPCFSGSVRLATNRGLLTFEELHLEQLDISIATDDRTSPIADGSLRIAGKIKTGVTMRKACPIFKTRKFEPVFRLETSRGYEIVATEDHRIFTPDGPRTIKDLRPGDRILLQSSRGHWSDDYTLPPFEPADKFKARIMRGEARLPKAWSRELGEVLGWIVGDGWLSSDLPVGRTVPTFTVGLTFGTDEKRELALRFRSLIKAWTGLEGYAVESNGTLRLCYRSALYYFARSLGLELVEGNSKQIPAPIWRAPREAVLGFLSALFTADGTVSLCAAKGSCSVRLAGSSKRLLQQVQQLLLNEGIVSSLRLRRAAGAKFMPDSRRRPALYRCAAQHEIIIDGQSRDMFVRDIGFLTTAKQRKALDWISAKKRTSNKNVYEDTVRLIEPAGTEDVYCTTEPETHSLIAGGIVAANCGEQPLLPWEPCNLGSLNLAAFVTGGVVAGRFDFPRLKEAATLAVRFLEDVIEVNDYPLPEIERMAKGNRRIGLGVMGWAEALVKTGTAYEDPAALRLADKVMSFINGTALDASEKIALERGVFPNWKDSAYDPVSKHFRGERLALRHCARTTIAPTGTIAIAAGLQGGGIEPFFAIAYTRYNAKALELLKAGKQPEDKDVFFEVNPLFREVAEKNDWFGLDEKTLMRRIDENHKSVRGVAGIPEKIQTLFSTAHDIAVETHVRMQAAFQRHTDNGVSKTINLPETATRQNVRAAYLLAYDLGCKGITIYRNGSKAQQVLNIAASPLRSRGKRLPPEASRGLAAEYYQIRTGYGPLHMHINYDEKGPFQVFTNIPPLGTEIAGLTSLIGILLSKYLAEGGDPRRIIKHLNSVKGDRPIGLGSARVDSIPHAIAVALRAHLKKTGWLEAALPTDFGSRSDEHCPMCFSRNVSRESGCSGPTCHDCGHSTCS